MNNLFCAYKPPESFNKIRIGISAMTVYNCYNKIYHSSYMGLIAEFEMFKPFKNQIVLSVETQLNDGEYYFNNIYYLL